jgi:class 3 adenylate cyclase
LEEQASAQAAPAEQRRLVTILFMDMVGSTSMMEKLDPEESQQVDQIMRVLEHSKGGQSIV